MLRNLNMLQNTSAIRITRLARERELDLIFLSSTQYFQPGVSLISLPYDRRNYSLKSLKPVELDYTESIPSDCNRTEGALVLVHGLL